MPPKEDEIMAGDLIQVQLDVDVFKIMQNEEHGGWNDRMAMVNECIFCHVCDYYNYYCGYDSLLVVLGKLIT